MSGKKANIWSCLFPCRNRDLTASSNTQPLNTTRIIDVDAIMKYKETSANPKSEPKIVKPEPIRPVISSSSSSSQSQRAPGLTRAANFDPFTYAVQILRNIEMERINEADDDTYIPKPDSPVRNHQHHCTPSSYSRDSPVRHHHSSSYDRDSPVRHHHDYSSSYDNHHSHSSSYDNHHNHTSSYDNSSSYDCSGGGSTSYD